VWLGFKGGKGMATFLGTLLALWFPAGAFACAIWLLGAFLFRYSSLAALMTASASPLVIFSMGKIAFALAALFMTLLIFIRHQSNIARLLKGEEPKIGARKKEAVA
ncbi:MAG TPA: glycerol-3-phosphate acyltransferase, partial [Parvularculaceae bacterium]|nr:glycerol-3-phosphate acyltransferase [Parvularculaceae bacterium]